MIDFVLDSIKYKLVINGSKIYLSKDAETDYVSQCNGIDTKILFQQLNESQNIRISETDDHTIELQINNNHILLFKKILFYVYVLELQDTKYYIGKSLKPMKRIGDHIPNGSSRGSGWTQMYKPLKILEIKEAWDPMEEDFTTLRYMNQMGIDNVRGGSFCELNLSDSNAQTLEKMMRGAEDKCYFCGSYGHLINGCDRKNIQRKTTKCKEKKIPKKEIPKSKILKQYGAEQLLKNSDSNVVNIVKDQDNSSKIKCKYCKMVFESMEKMEFHSEYKCPLNKKNQLITNVDKILEKNSKYI